MLSGASSKCCQVDTITGAAVATAQAGELCVERTTRQGPSPWHCVLTRWW